MLICSAVLLATLGWHGSATATESWQWQITLKGDPAGVPINMPSALYVDEKMERYYMVDSGRNRLVSFDKKGKMLSAFTANDQLRSPYDMTRDAEGQIFVVEKGRNTVTGIDLAQKKVVPHTITDKGRTVYVDRLETAAGDFYILDKASGNVLVADDTFRVKRRLTCGGCDAGFVDFKVSGGKVWALAPVENAVYRFRVDGTLEARVDLQESAGFLRAVAVDNRGRIFVLDRHAGEILVFEANGRFLYRFLTAGQARGQLYFPVDLQFDPWGRLCVVEEGNSRAQIFSRQQEN